MSEESRPVRCFMCATDYEYHLEGDAFGTVLYPSEKALREQRKCVDECGIVEVEVRLVRAVTKGKRP